MAVDGTSIITVADTGTPATIRFDLDTGVLESVARHPRSDATDGLHFYRFAWADNRVYAVNRHRNPGRPAILTLG